MAAGGLAVVVSTSGFAVDEEMAQKLGRLCHSVHVSVDGPDAAVHDPIRGRAGSFAESMAALRALDRVSAERRAAGQTPLRFGIDCTLVRANFDHQARFLVEVAPALPELEFVLFNCAIPNGLASRESYEGELLNDAQIALLHDEDFAAALQAQAPGRVMVALTDNTDLQMRPQRVREGTAALDFMVVEPDGQVRALPIYEGLVGNLLTEAPEEVWRRVGERRSHPFVVAELEGADTMAAWARATRNINQRFASPEDLVRIRNRPPYVPA
jgi:hypothetical protein